MTKENREIFDRLYGVIADRKHNPKTGSYTTQLFTGGMDSIGAKVLEEAAELVEAARNRGLKEVVCEAADLVYHTWVLLAQAGVTPGQVREELARREGISGLEEKAGRKGE